MMIVLLGVLTGSTSFDSILLIFHLIFISKETVSFLNEAQDLKNGISG